MTKGKQQAVGKIPTKMVIFRCHAVLSSYHPFSQKQTQKPPPLKTVQVLFPQKGTEDKKLL